MLSTSGAGGSIKEISGSMAELSVFLCGMALISSPLAAKELG
jgi:hypothetical protein